MGRHGENIFKRKDGRWEARFRVTVQGKPLYRSVYGKTYKQAKEKRTEVMSKQIASMSVSPKNFGELMELWLQNNQLHCKTQTNLRYAACVSQHITPGIGKLTLDQISELTINQYLYKEFTNGRLDGRGGLSPASIKFQTAIIASALKFGAEKGFCPPMKGKLIKPQATKKETDVIELLAQRKLEQELQNNLSGAQLAVYLSLHTGLRLGEICALQWKDVHIEERFLHISSSVIRLNENGHVRICIDTPKTAASIRKIPLTDTVACALEKEKQRHNSVFVIAGSSKDAFMNPRTLEYRFYSIQKKCGLPIVPFHALRHTFATRCISIGMDMKSLSEILGHANVSTTMGIYVHPSDELKRKAMERADVI